MDEIKQKYERFYAHAQTQIADFNLHRDELGRLVSAKKCFLWLVGIVITFTLSVGILKMFPVPEMVLEYVEVYGFMFVIFVCLVLGIFVYKWAPQQRDFTDIDPEAKLKNELMPQFVQLFGDFKWQKKHGTLIYDFGALQQTMIVPNNISIEGDDCISGYYKNVEIKITEVDVGKGAYFGYLAILVILATFGAVGYVLLSFISGIIGLIFQSANAFLMTWIIGILMLMIGSVQVIYYFCKYYMTSGRFHGVLIELDMPKPFLGHTFMYEKANTARPLRFRNKKGCAVVNLEDVALNRQYEIFSDNQIEARYILTPVFMEKIKNIALAFTSRYYRLSFNNNKMLLLAATDKDLFMMGDVRQDTNKETFDTLYAEMVSILQLVDYFNLYKPFDVKLINK